GNADGSAVPHSGGSGFLPAAAAVPIFPASEWRNAWEWRWPVSVATARGRRLSAVPDAAAGRAVQIRAGYAPAPATAMRPESSKGLPIYRRGCAHRCCAWCFRPWSAPVDHRAYIAPPAGTDGRITGIRAAGAGFPAPGRAKTALTLLQTGAPAESAAAAVPVPEWARRCGLQC